MDAFSVAYRHIMAEAKRNRKMSTGTKDMIYNRLRSQLASIVPSAQYERAIAELCRALEY